ncbi:hypothetical protein JCM10213_001700 [Rhodosporidiobolus nylandii]
MLDWLAVVPQSGIGLALLALLVFCLYEYRDRAVGDLHLGFMPVGRRRNWSPFYLQRELAHPKDRSKTASITIPGQRIILVHAPESIEYMQRTNFPNYIKGPGLYANMGVLGHGIFTSDGAAWAAARKTTSKIFNNNAYRGVVSVSLQRNLDKLLHLVDERAVPAEGFDISAVFFRFTLNTFTSMALGVDLALLDSLEPVAFAVAFDYLQIQEKIADRFRNPFWPLTERFDGAKAKVAATKKVVDNFSYDLIKHRKDGEKLTDEEVRNHILHLLVAGRDTTAQALCWTVFRLLKNPQCIEKLRQEVEEVGAVDWDLHRRLVYTTAVFLEGLRLHPSVPKALWLVVADDHIPAGDGSHIRVEKGDGVIWSDWERGRAEDIWGADAEEFKPERWIDEKGDLKSESQWKAHFFNGGYRVCLGQHLARFEAVTVLAALFRSFDFSFAPGYLENTPMVEGDGTPRHAKSLTLPMMSAPPTLSNLPAETLDQILSCVEEFTPRQRRQVYHALTLTSRALVPIVRRRLYGDPLATLPPTWERAINLLASLQANDGALSGFVTKLSELPAWVQQLSGVQPETTSLPFQQQGQTRAFSFQLAMISTCNSLSSVGLTFKTKVQCTLLSRAVEKSLSTLDHLAFISTVAFDTSYGGVLRFAEQLSCDEVPCLELIGVDYGRGKPLSKLSRLPIRLQRLVVRTAKPLGTTGTWYTYLSKTLDTRIIPQDLSGLHSLTVGGKVSDYSLPTFLKVVGGGLTTLRLEGDYRPDYQITRIYGTGTGDGPSLRPDACLLLPNLEHLEITGCRTLSVARLKALSTSSLHLISLTCRDSTWIGDEPRQHPFSPWTSAVFPQSTVASLLASFPHLQKVHLGHIPFRPQEDLSKLEDPLVAKGIEVGYELCA